MPENTKQPAKAASILRSALQLLLDAVDPLCDFVEISPEELTQAINRSRLALVFDEEFRNLGQGFSELGEPVPDIAVLFEGALDPTLFDADGRIVPPKAEIIHLDTYREAGVGKTRFGPSPE
tara:strand:- start:447 stop:812 length:366 start_codon:yes stop_codon:yes gene_type:complete